jgi:hypothetical protein
VTEVTEGRFSCHLRVTISQADHNRGKFFLNLAGVTVIMTIVMRDGVVAARVTLDHKA